MGAQDQISSCLWRRPRPQSAMSVKSLPEEGQKKSLWDPTKHDDMIPLWLAPAKRDPRRPREIIVDNMRETALNRKAPWNLATFREVLPWRYGNTVRAWRLLFDTNNSSRITFNEFGGKIRSLGYVGSIRDLWKELVPKGSEMSLMDLDPTTATKLEAFRLWVRDMFETAEDAMQSFAERGQKAIPEKSFSKKVKALGWLTSPEYRKGKVYPRIIHRWLDSEPTPTGFITVTDLEWLGLFDTGKLAKAKTDDDYSSTDSSEARERQRTRPIVTGLKIEENTVVPLMCPLSDAFGPDEVVYVTGLPNFNWPR